MRRKEFFKRPAIIVCWLSVFCLALGAVQIWHLNTTDTVVAQDDEADPGEANPGEGDGADDDDSSDDADGGTSDAPQTMGSWVYEALGPAYCIVFLSLSFTLVSLFVMNLLTARRENVCPDALVEDFEEFLNEKKYQDAYDLAKSDDSFLGQVLAAGLQGLQAGYPQALEQMQEVGEEENMKLEHRLSYLALIGTISPMVGLFGTVHGMIKSFQTIATAGGQPEPAALAGGISTALFTTLLGLAIAIPAIAAYNILKNRVSRLVLQVGILSERLMQRFEKVGGATK